MNLDGLFGALFACAPTDDDVVGKTDVNDIHVSTVFTFDMGYETALCDANDVHPVERYATLELAKEGHAKWCKKAKTAKQVLKLGYGDLVDAREVTLKRKQS